MEDQDLVGLDELLVEDEEFSSANFMNSKIDGNDKIGTVVSPTISDISTDDS